ncbi:HTH domain-containing protein [Aliiroseovarius sp. KMU-50]|uniref:HTH domain-containing protein n=1 Tax=Aliiroseovarius salicola TaxID=3009082 RepID=A0ABT4W3F4_9RHOB|nr:HTH domain-containing protein [Aliiroseovarius sp. KMU-50]MDA5094263.1 HTH domain-containing protein [Aliiroseovarius sp. KMU-50]
MGDLPWISAIKQVLENSPDPMHYKTIAEEISKLELRASIGATPANTVNAYINTSINNDGDQSPFVKAGRGYYFLKSKLASMEVKNTSEQESDQKASGVVQALGMYWRHTDVEWKSSPRLLGQEQVGSDVVDFSEQVGVYILHDRDRVVYVGRTTDRPIGQRLFEHTKGRLNGRWDRFSWFGLKSVSESGELSDVNLQGNDADVIIATLESVLIEALEPPQNRKRGDQLSTVEYLQVADPEKNKAVAMAMQAMMSAIVGE